MLTSRDDQEEESIVSEDADDEDESLNIDDDDVSVRLGGQR